MPTRAVIGRDEELDTIRNFLGAIAGAPAALVLSGEPGIGKSVLWEAGVERAEVARVLTHRSVETEALLSFAGLSDLLAPVFGEVADSLAPLRRHALEVALLLTEPGEQPADPRAIGLALLDVLRALADSGPVLVALDDVQWLDPASGSVLQIALRRLAEAPVGLLATLRKVPDVAAPLELERSFPEERVERLWLGPLSLGALHHLLKDRLELELTRPELARVQEASGGNPFFALELGRELARTNTRPAPGQALRIPESLHELLGGRLARLPAETAEVLLAVAALARPTYDLVGAALGDGQDVLEALDESVREGVLELDGPRLRFSHPLLASLCYQEAPLRKRREIHGALANAVSDTEERARHLALAAEGPDAFVASALDAATEQAATRGATAAAAELSELAAALTPDDPSLAQQRRQRAASFHRIAGDPERAKAMLERLLEELPHGVERADVLFDLATTFGGAVPRLLTLYDEALAETTGDDARSALMLAFRAWVRLLEADNVTALADARAALESAERVQDSRVVATVIARLGQIEMWAGDVTPGLLERGADLEERHALPLDYLNSSRFWLARLRMRQGQLDEARTRFDRLEAEASARGDEQTRIQILWYQSILDWWRGDWPRALERARDAYEAGEQAHFPSNRGWGGRMKGLIEADLGLVDEARASAEGGLKEMRAVSNEVFSLLCLGVRGRIELTLGDFEAAGRYLADLPEQLLASGLKDPTQPVWADAIETLVALGELEPARAALDAYEENAGRAGSMLALAGVERCRGLLLAAEGDPEAAFAAFDRSVEALGAQFPFERGRTLLCLGVVRRQAQQRTAAREALEQAFGIFEELGARPWAEKAQAELRRISGRRPADEELTETERRVAYLAAQGRSNKEIAAELFMGVSTVEAHLSRVYRKLEIRSRTALAARFAAENGQT